MEETYLDFRYLQLKKTPSSLKCATISMISGGALSLPYLLQIILGATSYVQIQSYHDRAGGIRCHLLLNNPFGFDFSRYVNYGFKVLAPDLVIFLSAILLWTTFMSFLLNDPKKKWQIFPITITLAFTLPVIIFTLSIFEVSRTLTTVAGFLNNPLSIYLLLSLALGITFGIKKLSHLIILGLFGYFLGYLILVYVINQITNTRFENLVPIARIVNWLTFAQIAKNLIWNFFIGIGVFSTYAEARKLSNSFARFDDTESP